MRRTQLLLAPLVLCMLAFGAGAQSAEFGRASGGEIRVITKRSRTTTGTLGLSYSPGFRAAGYEASVGGELLDDRLWFFAAGLVVPQTRFSGTELRGLDAKASVQPLDWAHITAQFARLQPQPGIGDQSGSTLFALRSTSILSERMTLDVSVSGQSATRQH